jgi:hypothetical protein
VRGQSSGCKLTSGPAEAERPGPRGCERSAGNQLKPLVTLQAAQSFLASRRRDARGRNSQRASAEQPEQRAPRCQAIQVPRGHHRTAFQGLTPELSRTAAGCCRRPDGRETGPFNEATKRCRLGRTVRREYAGRSNRKTLAPDLNARGALDDTAMQPSHGRMQPKPRSAAAPAQQAPAANPQRVTKLCPKDFPGAGRKNAEHDRSEGSQQSRVMSRAPSGSYAGFCGQPHERRGPIQGLPDEPA